LFTGDVSLNGNYKELAKDGESGFLVSAFDHEIVAKLILYLIGNKKHRNDMGKFVLSIIKNNFSAKKW